MSVLFASDVHLSVRRPDRVAAFLAFLEGPCRTRARLVLLGDIFDEWLGDDDARPPHPEVCSALAGLTAHGVRVDFCQGNHDFLTGEGFFRESGCTPLQDASVLPVPGGEAVVLHGDVLCTDDHDYQAWRRTFTDPAMQAQFLALPFEQRVARAQALRHESMRATRLKPEDIMDVNAQAVLDLLERTGADHMVHGHTHRPAIHSLPAARSCGIRVVLGDWYGEERVLEWDDTGPRLDSLEGLLSR